MLFILYWLDTVMYSQLSLQFFIYIIIDTNECKNIYRKFDTFFESGWEIV